MASSEMTIKLYIFPLTKAEVDQPNVIGYPYIMRNRNRLIEAESLGYADFNLNNYDHGRNLVVYNNVVYSIPKDYSDITNNMRIFVLKPLLNGCEQM